MPGAEMMLPAAALAKFALGYLAVLVAPGPNMLAVGALAALRGFRGVLPFCCGIAAGAGSLALVLHLALGLLADTHGIEVAARAIGGVMLLVVALRVMHTPRPCLPADAPHRHGPPEQVLAAFGAGFFTALSNPVTAAYCMAQFLGPLGATDAAWLAAPVVAGMALVFGLGVARVFGSPPARHMALLHHRTVCLLSGAALAALAALILLPLVRA